MDLDIAVIGMALRFPGASDVDTYWSNLHNGVDSTRTFSRDELLEAGIGEETLADPNYVPVAGYVEDVASFDARFFGYSPRDAMYIDPQQRVFLETAWSAMEDAGHDGLHEQLVASVFAGVGSNEYWDEIKRSVVDGGELAGFVSMMGNDKDFVASRVSYKLGLEGPSIAVQSACSTSLVAVHLACQSLLSQESDIALAGASTLALRPEGYRWVRNGIHSSDGRARPFDRASTGIVPGFGSGVVVLRRLEDAIAEGDNVRAIIKSTAVANDGPLRMGYSTPSAPGQIKLLSLAHSLAGVDPTTIGFVEGHGSGTALGDAVEIEALSKVFASATPGHHILGSVKGNIGHLDTAAGVAGFIKAVLSLERGLVPPTVNFRDPHPSLEDSSCPFFVNTAPIAWPTTSASPRRAGVTSLGLGGTNAHVILEQAPVLPQLAHSKRPFHVIPISAPHVDGLARAERSLCQYIANAHEVDAERIAYTLQRGRRPFKDRSAIVVPADSEAVRSSLIRSNGWHRRADDIEPQQVGFVVGDGDVSSVVSELHALWPQRVAKSLEACGSATGLHIANNWQTILKSTPASTVRFMASYTIADLFVGWGIMPATSIGVGIGALVADCLNRQTDLETAIGRCEDVANRSEFNVTTDTFPGIWLQIAPSNSSFALDAIQLFPSSSLTRIDWNYEHVMNIVSKLWVAGVDIDWDEIYLPSGTRRTSLPAYPFERKRHWIGAAMPSAAATGRRGP